MKKRYLRLAALTAGVLLAAQTGLSAAALSTFDAAYYAAQYPDVAAVCGNDEGALLRHYLDHGIDEGRKPSADGIAGDDELSLTEAQFSSVWSPVAINKLAHYKSLKRKCTDEEFAQAYQEALKVVTPLALMSRENQLYGIASACVRWWMMAPCLLYGSQPLQRPLRLFCTAHSILCRVCPGHRSVSGHSGHPI